MPGTVVVLEAVLRVILEITLPCMVLLVVLQEHLMRQLQEYYLH